jgi:guanylate kinase
MDHDRVTELANPNRLFVVSGPSGVGKNTVADRLFAQQRAVRAVTATTRPRKAQEADGEDYLFVSEDEFERWIAAGRLIEHTRYLGYYYGTPLESVNQAGGSGLPVVLTIDVDGGVQVKERWPEATLIFLEPPSEQELRRRLQSRMRDDSDSIERRLERAMEEYEYADLYDYRVVNDDLDRAVEEISAILARVATETQD